MGALEKFKQKMAEKRLIKELKPKPSSQSIKTADDVGNIINAVTNTATQTIGSKVPKNFSSYCRERYLALINAANFSVDDQFLNFNRPTTEQLAENPISTKDAQNDFLHIIYEPKEKNTFVDNEKESNNLRIEKLSALFQFHDEHLKIRFFRLTSELDTRSQDELENENAKVLNSHWGADPFFVKLPANALDLYLNGSQYDVELTTVLDYGVPPDDELMKIISKFMDILSVVLYELKTKINNFCRITESMNLCDQKGKRSIVNIRVLQYMPEAIEGLNEVITIPKLQQSQKKKPQRKPRIKQKNKK